MGFENRVKRNMIEYEKYFTLEIAPKKILFDGQPWNSIKKDNVDILQTWDDKSLSKCYDFLWEFEKAFEKALKEERDMAFRHEIDCSINKKIVEQIRNNIAYNKKQFEMLTGTLHNSKCKIKIKHT